MSGQEQSAGPAAGQGRVWAWFGLTLAFFAGFNLVKLPDKLARWMGYRGSEPMFKLDGSLNYSPAELYRVLEAYGPEGRRAQIILQWSMDGLFPLVYSRFMRLALAGLSERLWGKESRWRAVAALPGLTEGADYLENLSLALLMAAYPRRRLEGLARFANVMTLVKMVTFTINLGLILALALRVVLRKKA